MNNCQVSNFIYRIKIKVKYEKTTTGINWLIGVLIGISIIVLCAFFLEDGLATGIITGPPAALFIGFALEGLHQKPLTPKQKKMTRRLVTIVMIIPVIASLLGVILFLR